MRYTQLDGIRGILLVIMTINHFDSPLHSITFQTFGYVSAAEAFVFISGLIAGIVYNKKYLKFGLERVTTGLRSRSWTIYKYHILLFLLLFILSTNFSAIELYWHEREPLLRQNPDIALLLGGLLLYQPFNHDILPLYFVLILLAPIAFKKFTKGEYASVLLISFFFWMLGQLRTTDLVVTHLDDYIPVEIGKFDLLSWQFIFFTGLFLGFQEGNKRLEAFKGNVKVFYACLFAAFILFLVRHQHIVLPDIPYFGSLIIKQYVGMLRLINFFLLCYIVSFLLDQYKSLCRWKWVVFLGKHSLEVFSFHILLLTLFLPYMDQIKSYGPAIEILFTLMVVLSLSIPAYIHTLYIEAKNNRKINALGSSVKTTS